METKTTKEFRAKAKYKQPFDTFGCVLWIIFLNIFGLIIAAFLCKEKYFIVLELNTEDDYSIKKVQVKEIELYCIDVDDIVIEEMIKSEYGTETKYTVKKGNKLIPIKKG